MTLDVAQLERIGQGRGAEIFALPDDRVLKLARAGAGEALEELPSARTVLEQKITTSPLIPPAARDRALAVLWQLHDGDRLCHFDFHPANVMVDGRALTVIDWPGACRGDPLADVAATSIILRGGKTTPGTPLITRLFAPLGRKLVLGGYLRAYRKHGTLERERLARWLVVMAAQRLSYGIAGRRPCCST